MAKGDRYLHNKATKRIELIVPNGTETQSGQTTESWANMRSRIKHEYEILSWDQVKDTLVGEDMVLEEIKDDPTPKVEETNDEPTNDADTVVADPAKEVKEVTPEPIEETKQVEEPKEVEAVAAKTTKKRKRRTKKA